MRSSLKVKLAFALVLIVAGSVWANWFINLIFQERYYTQSKEEDLYSVYSMFSEIASGNGFTIKEKIKLTSSCESENITAIVLDSSFNPIFYSGYNVVDGGLVDRVKDLVFGNGLTNAEMLNKNEKYTLVKMYDKNSSQSYLEMFGTFETGDLFLMRTSMESIKEVVKVSNQFFAYAAGGVILLSVIVILVFSVSITNRIENLAYISAEMSNLNFNVKYKDGGNDEITMLGNNINSLSEKLEHTISELKTANNELKKDIEKKTQIDEMRKEFLSNVSHELKTPIAIIQGYAEGLLESVNDDPESREYYCDVIIDESQKMDKMVKKLLTLNQLEFGNQMIEMERFDLITAIDQVLNKFSVIIEEKDVKVIFDNKKNVDVWADEFQSEEIITNYISNALNHIANERIIKIELEENEKCVRCIVFNTGEHIPSEDIDKIWQKFYKVDKARTREYGGSGIGLSIVKAIADSMNQQCGVNNVDGGVEFWFTLEKIS